MKEGDPLRILKLIKKKKKKSKPAMCAFSLCRQSMTSFTRLTSLCCSDSITSLESCLSPPRASVSPLMDVRSQLPNQQSFVPRPVKEMLKKMLLILRLVFKANS